MLVILWVIRATGCCAPCDIDGRRIGAGVHGFCGGQECQWEIVRERQSGRERCVLWDLFQVMHELGDGLCV